MYAEKYNSVLYGYGLTLSVLNQIKINFTYPPIEKYLDINVFFNDFVRFEDHKRIKRNFNKYFELNSETIKTHIEMRNYLFQRLDEILEEGFESWVGKNLFSKENQIPKTIMFYLYILYNYWYHLIHQNILIKPEVVALLRKICEQIKQKIEINKNIYTLNFDTILDDCLNPQHLHGIFVLPLNNIQDLMLNSYNEKEFEYTYLFGTNGLEKLSRMNKIRKFEQNKYDLDFFYKKDINLGNLLIYGVSFRDSGIITNNFLKEYPQHENQYLVKSVDGHILLKLDQLYKNDKIEGITISYFSQNDLENYKDIIRFTDFNPIVEYKQCDDIFNFNP